MAEDITEKLHGLTLPDGVAWWPPAIGWWLIFAVIVLSFVLWWYRRYKTRNPVTINTSISDAQNLLERAYKNWCDNNNDHEFISQVSILLRRLLLSIYPRQQIAGMTGTAWLQLLDQGMSDKPFSKGAGMILLYGPYQKNINYDLTQLYKLCHNKIKQIEMGEPSV